MNLICNKILLAFKNFVKLLIILLKVILNSKLIIKTAYIKEKIEKY